MQYREIYLPKTIVIVDTYDQDLNLLNQIREDFGIDLTYEKFGFRISRKDLIQKILNARWNLVGVSQGTADAPMFCFTRTY